MARFFIDRPIFAWVIALFIIVMGANGVTDAFVLTEFFGEFGSDNCVVSINGMIDALADIMQEPRSTSELHVGTNFRGHQTRPPHCRAETALGFLWCLILMSGTSMMEPSTAIRCPFMP